MTFNQLKMALYATFLTNVFGLRLKASSDAQGKKALRYQYSKTLLDKLKIDIRIEHADKLPTSGQCLLLCNHRSILDPTIIEIVLKDTQIFGHWIAKKELYHSFFFGLFVRNAGTILLDRDAAQMNNFFRDIKKVASDGNAIFMFPEGTRNTSKDEITTFKEGARLMARRVRLPMLPVYIKTHANDVLMAAIRDSSQRREITTVIGDMIDYRDKSVDIEVAYRDMFGLRPKGAQT